MEKIRLYAQSIPITFESWILSFVGIVLVRIFFEQFSSFMPGRFLVIEMPAIIHCIAFFLATIVGLMMILMIFAKTSLKEVAIITLFGSFALWIPPLVDLATGGVGGHIISYLFVSGKELFLQFITYFSHGPANQGVTLGMKVEGLFGIVFISAYVYTVTKSIVRSLGAIFTFYCFLFLLGSIPSLIALFLPQLNGVLLAILHSIFSSQIITNNIHPSFSATNIGLIDLAFDKIMIGTNTIVLILATISLFFIGAREKLIAVIKNSRPERLFYFFLLSLFGVALAGGTWFGNWIDIQTRILAIIVLISAGMFSIFQNDIHDEKIDAVSNTDRPLISKTLSKDDMETISKIFLIFALVAAYAISHYVLFFTCFGIFIYFIYSNPPLRLKRFVLINSGLVSLACLSPVMGGFFLISPDKAITAFPFSIVIAIIIFHTTVSNIRDLKDVEGDRAGGIKTLPVLIGLKRSKQIIAGIICFFFLIIPWYFHIQFLILPSIIAAILSWYFINEENYKEWKAFAVYLIYFILIIGSLVFK